MELNDLRELGEEQGHPEREQAARRSTWVSVAVNLVLTALQVAVGLYVASQALVADGIHSLSDLAADFVVLLALQHSRKAPDASHPYGHQRYENAASLVLGALLLAVGAGMLWSAAGKLSAPETIAPGSMFALGVALFTLATIPA
jgi:cation diffusion facilitator family transporter